METLRQSISCTNILEWFHRVLLSYGKPPYFKLDFLVSITLIFWLQYNGKKHICHLDGYSQIDYFDNV